MKYKTAQGKWSRKVYGCRFCWSNTIKLRDGIIKQKDILLCTSCDLDGYRNDSISFDSQVEQEIGITLKRLQKAGKITGLKHHEKFNLLPDFYYDPAVNALFFMHELPHIAKHQKKYHIKIPHQCGCYESDFTFTQDGIRKVIEVKNLGKKEIARKIKDARTGKIYKTKQRIDYPKFIHPESQFKLKCKLMKRLHGLDVEVWTVGKKYRYDANWKLVEVIK